MAKVRQLILASGSAARQAMLTAAGVTFDVVPADIDEESIIKEMIANDPQVSSGDIASSLAGAKAASIAKRYPDAFVIGSDQVLMDEARRIFFKADTRERARDVLRWLRGTTHTLTSAVALAESASVIWQTSQMARLTMRNFSDEFLDGYMARAGDCLTKSVGAYAFEGLGGQLFDRVEGDHFTILGMPLLPLLQALRERGVLDT